jgi:glycosyltransferase 2 family protein
MTEKARRNSRKHRYSIRLVGVFLLAYLLSNVDFAHLGNVLESVHALYMWMAVVTVMIALALKTWRWVLILSDLSVSITYFGALDTVMTSLFWGAITPGRMGELYRFKPFVHSEPLLRKSVAAVLLDRFSDVLPMMLWGAIGLVYFSTLLSIQFDYLSVLGILAFVGIMVSVFMMREHFKNLVRYSTSKFLAMLSLDAEKFDLGLLRKDFTTSIGKSPIKVITLSLGALGSSFVGIYLVAIALDVRVGFFYLSFCYTVAALVSFLPISFGGVGTREAVFAVTLGRLGISLEQALLLSLTVNLVYNVLLVALSVLSLRGISRLFHVEPTMASESHS